MPPLLPKDLGLCQCGFMRLPTFFRHSVWHKRWVMGVPLHSHFKDMRTGLLTVGPTSPSYLQEPAYSLAEALAGDQGYLVVPLPDPRLWGTYSTYPKAILAVRWHRAVGIAVVNPGEDGSPTVAYIFTALLYRRKGIGSELVRAAASGEGVEVAALSWLAPVSWTAQALVLHLTGGHPKTVEHLQVADHSIIPDKHPQG